MQDVYGFDMTPVADTLLPGLHNKGNVLEVHKEDLVTSEACIKVCAGGAGGARGSREGEGHRGVPGFQPSLGVSW